MSSPAPKNRTATHAEAEGARITLDAARDAVAAEAENHGLSFREAWDRWQVRFVSPAPDRRVLEIVNARRELLTTVELDVDPQTGFATGVAGD